MLIKLGYNVCHLQRVVYLYLLQEIFIEPVDFLSLAGMVFGEQSPIQCLCHFSDATRLVPVEIIE